jgi:dihydropteroate synthase
MTKYYTRACNFYYGNLSSKLVKKKYTLPVGANKNLSFDKIEIFSRNKKKITSRVINIKKIRYLSKAVKKKVMLDIKNITSKRIFLNNRSHLLMGILNMTPDSFSDGGKFNTSNKAFKRISEMISSGADIIDIGGESTRPGAKIIPSQIEWKRIEKIFKNFKKKFPKTLLSIDTRKSLIMKNAISFKTDMINDVSCFKFDINAYKIIRNKNLWKIIHHMQGTPQTMQINPKYKHVLLDIYDFFEKEVKKQKKDKYYKKIILDPGIGFGKNLKHNLMILSKISIFHSLGFPVLIGTSRKKFINQISKNFDTKERLGGTLSSVLFSLSQGIQIFRVHNVEEIKQGILVYETLLNK